jgi:beta-glucosidase
MPIASGLPAALERGCVTMTEIDEAVRRVLTLKQRLGLFEQPYRRGAAAERTGVGAGRRRLAREHRRTRHRDAQERVTPLCRCRIASPPRCRRPAGGRGCRDGRPVVAGRSARDACERVAGLRAALPGREVLHARRDCHPRRRARRYRSQTLDLSAARRMR